MSDRQYQTIAAPLIIAPVDAPQTSDRWLRQQPDPVRRPWAAAMVVMAGVTVVSPIPNVPPTSGGSVIPHNSTQITQYQALTGPLDVPSTTPLALNWQPQYPDRVTARPRLQTGSQRWYVSDRADAPSVPSAPDQSWNVELPERTFARANTAYRAQAFAFDTVYPAPPISTALVGWRARYPDQHAPMASRAPYVWAQPHFVVEVDVPVMSWTGVYLDPPPRLKQTRAHLAQAKTAPLNLADITTTTPDLSWEGSQPDQVPGPHQSVAALQARAVSPLYLADITVTAPTLSARAIYPDRVPAKQSLGASQRAWTMDATWTAPAPVVAPALAAPVYPNTVPGKVRPTSHPDLGMPEYVLDVTVPAPTLSWAPTYPDRQRWLAPVAQQQTFTADTTMFVTNFNPAWAQFNVYLGPGEGGIE